MNSLYKLPRAFLVTLLIGIGIAYVILNDPPHTFCKTQVEHFQFVQKGIIFKDPQDKIHKKTLMSRLIETCRKTVSPGGCYEYFSYLRRLLRDFRLVSTDCLKEVSLIEEVKQHLLIGTKLMVLIAWREEALTGQVDKFNWLNRTDMSLFCTLKKQITLFYGNPTWLSFEDSVLKQLPLSQKVSLQYLKKFSILSEPCSIYP